jgi:outer membrane receptor protein involved in Fe transport
VINLRFHKKFQNFTIQLNINNLTNYAYTEYERNMAPLRSYNIVFTWES